MKGFFKGIAVTFGILSAIATIFNKYELALINTLLAITYAILSTGEKE